MYVCVFAWVDPYASLPTYVIIHLILCTDWRPRSAKKKSCTRRHGSSQVVIDIQYITAFSDKVTYHSSYLEGIPKKSSGFSSWGGVRSLLIDPNTVISTVRFPDVCEQKLVVQQAYRFICFKHLDPCPGCRKPVRSAPPVGGGPLTPAQRLRPIKCAGGPHPDTPLGVQGFRPPSALAFGARTRGRPCTLGPCP